MSRLPTQVPDNSDVTIVVTCYNHQAFVEQCLESIAAQTVAPCQVIIVDDASTDESAWVIKQWLEFREKDYTFIRHDVNLGLCATLNEALRLVEGRFYTHVSSDDWQALDRIERQSALFEQANQDIALLVGDISEVEVGGVTIMDHDYSSRFDEFGSATNQHALLPRLLEGNIIAAPSVMLRTDLARAVGGYDESLEFEDYDMWMRLTTRYSLIYAAGIVASYRIVGAGMLRSPKRRVGFLASEAAMLAKHIGSGRTNDITITKRLAVIAGALIELGAAPEVRAVLANMARASQDPWIGSMQHIARRPNGIKKLESEHGEKFGILLHLANE